MNSSDANQDARTRRSDAQGKPGFASPSFVLLFVAHLIVVSTYFLFITTMARHAVETFSCSSSTAGFVASIFLVGAAISRVFAGRYADALGLKRCSLLALALMLASCLLYPLGDASLPVMFAIRFVHGLSFGIANTTMPAIATELIPVEVMGEGTGWFMLSNSLGVGVGPLFGLLTAGHLDYGVLYPVCSALVVVALAATVPLSAGRVPPEGTRAAVRSIPRFRLSLVLDPATRRFSFYMFIVAFSYSSINSFVDSYSNDIGLGGWAPFLFLVYAVGLVLMRPPLGKLQDRRGENVVFYPSIVCMALATLVCAACSVVTTPVLLLAVGFFAAAGFGTCMSAGLGVIGRMSGGTRAAPAIATFYLLCDFGCGIGPFVLGFVVGRFGYPAMYVACACIALVGLVYYHFSHGRRVRGTKAAS